MLQAMIDASSAVGVNCTVTQFYTGQSPLLMSYGLGHKGRREGTERHIRNGGNLVGWDMGYWDRGESMRMTVNADHPYRLIHDMPADRFEASGIQLRNDHDPWGPILLVGMGIKSRQQFGYSGNVWERSMLKGIEKVYRKHKVLYRPKKPERLDGLKNADGQIEDVLRGASLVVCRHSNVAVDACIAGVPVVCMDGAARALYGSDLRNPVKPDESERRRFLNNLAWWQWKPREAEQAWRFLLKVCDSTSVRDHGGQKVIST